MPRVSQIFFPHKGFCNFPVSRHFPYPKDFAVFPVSRHFTYPKDFAVFPVSRHFLFSKVLETGKTTKSSEKNHFFQGIWSFFLFPNTFEKGKCLEIGKTAKSFEYGKCLETGEKTAKSFEYGKCLETGKTSKSVEHFPYSVISFFGIVGSKNVQETNNSNVTIVKVNTQIYSLTWCQLRCW